MRRSPGVAAALAVVDAYRPMVLSELRLLSCRLWLVVVAAAWLVAGCAENVGYASPSFATQAAMPTASRVIRVGIGDKIKVTVFGEDSLTTQVEVNGSGQIALPLVGEVSAKGKSLAELRETIVRRYSEGFLKNPRVNVEILNFRPIYVHGEVRSGGEFAFKNGLTFRDAVALAGGYTYRAQQSHLILVREGGREERIALPTDMLVLPGDNIRIPERFF